MKVDVDFDEENDILYFYSSESGVDYSIDYDDVVMDVSGNKVTGVEIMGASEKFGLDKGVDFVEAYMDVKYGVDSMFVKVGFSLVSENAREGMLIQVPLRREMVVS